MILVWHGTVNLKRLCFRIELRKVIRDIIKRVWRFIIIEVIIEFGNKKQSFIFLGIAVIVSVEAHIIRSAYATIFIFFGLIISTLLHFLAFSTTAPFFFN